MSKIFLLIICVFLFKTSFGKVDDSASLKNYSKIDCKNFTSTNAKNWKFENSDYQTSWLKILKDKTTLAADFNCANGKTRHLKLDIGPETNGGEAVERVICDKNFLLIAYVGPLGEGSATSYLNLQTCEDLGSGDEEYLSGDKKMLVLTSNGTDAGYVEAALNVIDCRGEDCKKIWGGKFGQDGFFNLKWNSNTSFVVERDDRQVTGEGPKWLCTFDAIKSSKLSCKKR